MPLVPKRQARRLDRMARRAHLFHRYAHHPLCDEYGSERLTVGGLHLCRGCSLSLLGALAGMAGGLAIPSGAYLLGWVLATVAVPLAVSRQRRSKWLTRFLP